MLPVHEKKKPPKQIDMAVCLLTHGNRVYVTRREERMLGGLYVFQLIEDENRPAVVEEILRESGFDCRFAEDLGEAKHVFTHRVWNMRILHFELNEIPAVGQMVDQEEMDRLPFPTAIKAAVREAQKLLGGKKNG